MECWLRNHEVLSWDWDNDEGGTSLVVRDWDNDEGGTSLE